MKDYKEELLEKMPDEMLYENLTLKNDFIFGKVMQNKEICVELIQILTGNQMDEGVTINNQKPVKVTNDSRGVRYDVYVEDDVTAYDAEMQNYDKQQDLPRRSRYYQGMMDLNLLESGGDYKDLKNSYVIFICTYDSFGKELCCYRFGNMCIDKSEEELLLKDGRTILIFNTKGSKVNVSGEIKEFLDYVETEKTSNSFLKKLDREVKKAKENKEWRVEYMKTWLHDMDMKNEGREEGREEGIRILITTSKEYGIPEETIKVKLVEKYKLTEQEADEKFSMILKEENNYKI